MSVFFFSVTSFFPSRGVCARVLILLAGVARDGAGCLSAL